MSDHIDSLRYLELRDQARRLRRLADELDDEAARYQGEADATIGGYALVDAAVAILEDQDQGHGLHLRELLATIECRTGRRVTGTDPYATLLANIGRDPRIEPVRPRSGLYRLARVPA